MVRGLAQPIRIDGSMQSSRWKHPFSLETSLDPSTRNPTKQTVSTLSYFPLKTDRFDLRPDVRTLKPNESILERTGNYAAEISLKRRLLEEDKENYLRVTRGCEASMREASMLLTGTESLVEASLGMQEDLVILRGDPSAGHPLIAGIVCFPNGWSIADKIDQPIDAVHDPVPGYAEVMSQTINRLLEGLKPERPVWRTNWGVRPSGLLDQSPKKMSAVREAARHLNASNVGRECFFRVERQTLSRLPRTNDILFTIHTHQCPIRELETWQQRNLRGVLASCPEDMLLYKGIAPFKDLLLRDLERRLRERDSSPSTE